MRVFCDRDVGPSIGLALRAIGIDVQLHRERYPAVSGMIPDDRWIAEVTAEGRLIITKDTHIRTRHGERAVFEAAGARVIVIATRGATKLENLRALLIAWPQILREHDARPAPFMFGVARDGRMTRYVPPPGGRR